MILVEARPTTQFEDDENVFVEELKVMEVISNLGHTVFAALLEQYEVAQNLTLDGPYTVFAPTDEAFNDIKERMEAMTFQEIQILLKRHVVQDYIRIEAVEEGMVAKTMDTQEVLEFSQHDNGGYTFVKGETSPWIEISFSNVEARNGLVHEISNVII